MPASVSEAQPEHISGAVFYIAEDAVSGMALNSSQGGFNISGSGLPYASPKWAIVSPDGGHPFQMGDEDAEVGLLQVGPDTHLLDFELKPVWHLTVGVFTSFAPYNAFLLVTVYVLDVNEAPSFYEMPTTITVMEDASPGY